MATIRKRNGKWHVQVRRAGHPTQTKSFLSKPDAQKWGRLIEAQLDKQVLPYDPKQLEQTTVADLLTRYRDTVTPNKRGAASERKRIDVFMRQEWAAFPLSKASAQVFSRFRDQRLKAVQPGTVIRDLGLLRAIFETAIREWSLPLPENPLAKVRKPKAPDARERRLEAGELDLILQACQDSRNDWLRPAILFAIETGMRRGELLNVRWRDIDHDASTLLIPETKNGHARCIPLTDRALMVLVEYRPERGKKDEHVFPVSANAFRLAWERCKRRIAKTHPDIAELRFHDLRHEAVSRFFELGLSVPEVALISGHRDPRMLFRYTHLRAEDLVAKLRTAMAA